RVVELACLADDDGARPDDQDRFDVVPARHQAISSRKRWNRWRESWGPGAASGWYWTENAGMSRQRSPSSVPSFKFQCVSATRPNGVSTIVGPAGIGGAGRSTPHPSGSTAKPWLCEVISTRPLSRSLTGWFT